MPQDLRQLKETPSQTAGPYVHIGLAPGAAGFEIYDAELGRDIVGANAKGERIKIEGVVSDGTGALVKDVLLEIWQADAEGNYRDPDKPDGAEDGFRGWGRVISDFETGEWAFETIKPGRVEDGTGDLQAPHLNLWIVARGINIGLNTRLYFEDETTANLEDPVLGRIELESRRATLVAKCNRQDGVPVYRFDIRLQGDDETVFFDV